MHVIKKHKLIPDLRNFSNNIINTKYYRKPNKLNHAPYKNLINSGYHIGGIFTIDISVGYIDADYDSIMLDAWHMDDSIIEEVWNKPEIVIYQIEDDLVRRSLEISKEIFSLSSGLSSEKITEEATANITERDAEEITEEVPEEITGELKKDIAEENRLESIEQATIRFIGATTELSIQDSIEENKLENTEQAIDKTITALSTEENILENTDEATNSLIGTITDFSIEDRREEEQIDPPLLTAREHYEAILSNMHRSFGHNLQSITEISFDDPQLFYSDEEEVNTT